jgi:polyisoprenyl-phosphate glycosyltransferase
MTSRGDSIDGLIELSIVVPAHNEADCVCELYRRTVDVARTHTKNFELIFVNDGSTDNTSSAVKALTAEDERVVLINLSRNFGKEIAMSAGIDFACGQAVVIIDADLQDPPELIPEMLRIWREEAADVVYAQRRRREGETWLKLATAGLFYWLMRDLGRVRLPENAGDFRLLSRRAVEALKAYPEHHRFMKGLFAWIGFDQRAVPYDRAPRYNGRTKWGYLKLIDLAIEGITSFTAAPLRLASIIGILVAMFSLLFACWVVYRTLVWGDPVQGFPSLMVAILFLGGIQLTAIGVLGEYVGRIFYETKRRPLYHVAEVYRSRNRSVQE